MGILLLDSALALLCKLFLQEYPANLPLEPQFRVHSQHSSIIRSIPCLHLLIAMLACILDYRQFQSNSHTLSAILSDYASVPLIEAPWLSIALPDHTQSHISITVFRNEIPIR